MSFDVLNHLGKEEQEIVQLDNFALFQNYPNPFNPITKIKYIVPENAGIVTIMVYDETSH
jgi:hypothetical protein